MTNEEFEKRMDRLTGRHEVFAQSVEGLRASLHEEHEAAIEQGKTIDKILAAIQKDGEHIARIAENR